MLVPLESTGIDAGDAHVHWGFQNAYNGVATNVLRVVGAQLRAHPGYTVIAVGANTSPCLWRAKCVHLTSRDEGHSLGGAIASLCGLSLKVNFPEEDVKIYTFGELPCLCDFSSSKFSAGQPRTGDAPYATLVEQTVGLSNVFRGMAVTFLFVTRLILVL